MGVGRRPEEGTAGQTIPCRRRASEPGSAPRYVVRRPVAAALWRGSVPVRRCRHDPAGALSKAWRNLGGALGSPLTVGHGWDIRLCGPVVVEAEGRRLDAGLPGRQGRLLFVYLVLNRARGCPRDELIDVLWPEGPPAAADSALSALLSKLRRALGEGVLTGRGELRLRLEDPVVDIEESAAAIAEAEVAMEAGDHALAARRARDALSTDLQTFLPDAEGGWAADQRRELGTPRVRALRGRAGGGPGPRPAGGARAAAAARARDARRGGPAPGRPRARRG